MKIGVCMPYMVRDYDRDRILTWARKIDQGPFYANEYGAITAMSAVATHDGLRIARRQF